MEDNKDFDKDKQETGTQQMPHVPTEGEEDEKKGTIVLFGHEFDKKAVMAGLGGLLAIALIGGGVWYAASQKPEPKEPTPIEQTEKTEQHVIQLGAKADGWVKGESSPVIAHIVNKEEKVDYYHAYDANEPHALDVPAEGEYEVSFISPVDKDGSIYEVPKTAKVKSEAEDKDGKDTGDELPFEFKPIAADKTDADALNAIVKSVGDAVKKGDETLTGANGTKVIELVKENAKANPNADKEKVEEESQKAEDSNKDNGETKPGNAGGDGNNNAGGESGANGQNQGGDGGGSSNSGNSSNDGGSQHVHNWVTQTIHHNAQYQTIHHEAVYDYRSICNGCGADITGNVDAHMQDALLNGNTACGAYHTENVLVSQAWDETVEISPAWDEIVYICSSCGAPM
nr:MAG TPA: Transcription initiation factor TFIID subunit, DNA, Nuclear [Caudoviricetes sp.]